MITSDRPPRELEALEERLRSRFGQGVVVDISRPDLETRIAILRKQVKWEGFQIADPDVLEWIAARVTTNIRELYGALTRAVSYASISGSEVTLDITKEALKDILPKAYQHPVTVEMVQAEVARQFGLHVNDLRGNRRTQDVAYARQIAMYLARDLTEASLPQIGDTLRRPSPHDGDLRGRQDRPATQGRPRPATAGPRRAHQRASQDRSLRPARAFLHRPCRQPPPDRWTFSLQTAQIGYASLNQTGRRGRSVRFCTQRPQRRAEADTALVQEESQLSTSSTGAMTTMR